MKRVLIIITRISNEFKPYWLGVEDQFSDECPYSQPQHYDIGDNHAIIINGLNIFDSDSEFGESIKKILNCTELINYLSKNTIGLISHGFEERGIDYLKKDYNIAFNEKYSSTKGDDFCQRSKNDEGFIANNDPTNVRTGVLDAFRDALVISGQKDKQAEAFDNLWKYFDKHSNLNIKLNILHQCLIQKDAKQIVWPDELNNEKKAISNFDHLKQIDGTDIFDPQYLESLTDLRDSLLSR